MSEGLFQALEYTKIWRIIKTPKTLHTNSDDNSNNYNDYCHLVEVAS